MGCACAILEFSMEHVSYSMDHADMSVNLLDFHAMLPWRRDRWDNGGKFCHGGSWEHTNGEDRGAQSPSVLTHANLGSLQMSLTHRMMMRKNHQGSEFFMVLSHS